MSSVLRPLSPGEASWSAPDRCTRCGEGLGLTEYGARHARCSEAAPGLLPPLRSYHSGDDSPCLCTAKIPEAGCPFHDPSTPEEELRNLRSSLRYALRTLTRNGAAGEGDLPALSLPEIHETAVMLDRLSCALSTLGGRIFERAIARMQAREARERGDS